MKRLLYILVFGLILSACELTVPIELPDQTPRLVINSFLYADSQSIQAWISRSYGMYDAYSDDSVAGVQVFCSVDNQPEVEMSRTKGFVFVPNVFSDSSLPISAGRTYRIRATAPGFPEAYGETTIPQQVAISQASVIKQERIVEGDTLDAVDLTFTDPAGGDNRYALLIRANDGFAGYYEVCYQTSDPLLADTDPFSGGGSFTYLCRGRFRDDLIDGRTYTLRIYLNARETQWINGDLEAVLLSMDESMYNYWVSSELQQVTSFNPFAEPAIVSNSITNGFGVVGSCHTSSIKIPY